MLCCVMSRHPCHTLPEHVRWRLRHMTDSFIYGPTMRRSPRPTATGCRTHELRVPFVYVCHTTPLRQRAAQPACRPCLPWARKSRCRPTPPRSCSVPTLWPGRLQQHPYLSASLRHPLRRVVYTQHGPPHVYFFVRVCMCACHIIACSTMSILLSGCGDARYE